MTDRKILGSNIRRYRQFRGLSKKALAEKVNLSTKTIERLELGKEEYTKNIGLDNLLKICKTLNVTMEELFLKDGDLLSVRFVISEHNVDTLKELVKIVKDLIENK